MQIKVKVRTLTEIKHQRAGGQTSYDVTRDDGEAAYDDDSRRDDDVLQYLDEAQTGQFLHHAADRASDAAGEGIHAERFLHNVKSR